MSVINYAAREITCKLVYYGPGLCGKTTNVEYIHEHSDPSRRGRLTSLKTESDRTLFFDFCPLDVGRVRGFRVRFHLYTVPGQVFYQASRRIIVRGADGIVFVADSQPERMEANKESVACMIESIETNQLEHAPVILQCNKQDIPGALEVAEIRGELGLEQRPTLAASATNGDGVFETLRLASKAVLRRLSGEAPNGGCDALATTATL
jgi:mutual gliding-motility protein MglA